MGTNISTRPVDDRVGTPPARPDDQNAAAPRLSLPRLYLLRAGYLFLGAGLASWKWPQFIHHETPWTSTEGVVNCMLVALSILALLGLRYPVQMLPILLFESAWKAIWLATIALPAWRDHQLDPATRELTGQCLLVVVILATIPWPQVIRHYAGKPGDRWR
jgi:hypothetical protein